MIPWLDETADFPPVESALTSPNGLLAAGASLAPEKILSAYRRGIFPWYSPGDPILWWSPSPRMVLMTDEFHCSRSLRKRLRSGGYEVRFDQRFNDVVCHCAGTPRPGQDGTWISAEMQAAYGTLHELGHAHSVEVIIDGKLAGGLYGIALGRMFFGESMFSLVTDASKIAVAHLVDFLRQHRFAMIDCQMETPHLASLGARTIARSLFIARVAQLVDQPSSLPSGHWPNPAIGLR
jgi:leucyl/phenylalanyl-tRNA--protein transferase